MKSIREKVESADHSTTYPTPGKSGDVGKAMDGALTRNTDGNGYTESIRMTNSNGTTPTRSGTGAPGSNPASIEIEMFSPLKKVNNKIADLMRENEELKNQIKLMDNTIKSKDGEIAALKKTRHEKKESQQTTKVES
eukprot:CCRYP_015013-RA/>CCRYP_015013-RA protein AED:0.28 eAED:0.28 QI:0/-1/0/1/-1/1/1/0/136